MLLPAILCEVDLPKTIEWGTSSGAAVVDIKTRHLGKVDLVNRGQPNSWSYKVDKTNSCFAVDPPL